MKPKENSHKQTTKHNKLLFSRLVENSKDLIYRYEILPRRGFTYINPAAQAITGYSPQEYYANPDLGLGLIDTESSENKPRLQSWVRKDGSLVWLEQHNVRIYNEAGNIVAIEGMARDVTEREEVLQALRLENERFLRFFDANIVGIFIADARGNVFMANDSYLDILGVRREEFLESGINWRELTPTEWLPADEKGLRELQQRGLCSPYEKEYLRSDGRRVPVYLAKAMLPGPEKQIATFILDITERRLAEQALQVSYDQLQRAEQIGQLGHWEWVVRDDQVNWSDGLYRLFGLGPEEFTATYNAYLQQVHPEDLPLVKNAIQAALQKPGPFEFESRILRPDGQTRYLFTRGEVLFAGDGRPERMIGVVVDTTERVYAERAVQTMAEDLRRSNAELEQFAYVASHDLQEPLRMVTSFVQLLAQRYRGKLDEDADAFIGYAVDGAKRMQHLINDLLAYSRLGTRGSPFTLVSMEALLRDAQQDLQIAIEESRAQISHDSLPELYGDPSQLGAVLQNLLSNAIKYRGADAPQIHVSVRRQRNEWVFSVRDNGIGIDPKFAERIFIIFQRLHAPGAYPGTGIGLAVCKRILQRHGGEIWVESFPGQGATFYFTLPIERSL